jgi:hypothetical protein
MKCLTENYVSADGTCSGATSPRKVFVSKVARFVLYVYFVFRFRLNHGSNWSSYGGDSESRDTLN